MCSGSPAKPPLPFPPRLVTFTFLLLQRWDPHGGCAPPRALAQCVPAQGGVFPSRCLVFEHSLCHGGVEWGEVEILISVAWQLGENPRGSPILLPQGLAGKDKSKAHPKMSLHCHGTLECSLSAAGELCLSFPIWEMGQCPGLCVQGRQQPLHRVREPKVALQGDVLGAGPAPSAPATGQ